MLNEVCERSLRGAALWDEVKDRLHESALGMSGGQQQRLCIARAIAAEPEVLLLDEPCSALDPIATGKIEDLIQELRGSYSVLMVTHNMQQASRASDFTAFMYLGRLIEYGPTDRPLHQAHPERDRRLRHRTIRLRFFAAHSTMGPCGRTAKSVRSGGTTPRSIAKFSTRPPR